MKQSHSVAFSDEAITEEYNRKPFPNPDNPSEASLVEFRGRLPVVGDPSIISLHYLRNRIVHLRKKGVLTKRYIKTSVPVV